jgi:hypothetical protein
MPIIVVPRCRVAVPERRFAPRVWLIYPEHDALLASGRRGTVVGKEVPAMSSMAARLTAVAVAALIVAALIAYPFMPVWIADDLGALAADGA